MLISILKTSKVILFQTTYLNGYVLHFAKKVSLYPKCISIWTVLVNVR